MEIKMSERIVKIITGYNSLIGRIVEENEYYIVLKDVCNITMQRDRKNINFSFHKIKGEVVIRGSCCIFEVDETDNFYKSYMQTITGIIPVSCNSDFAKKRFNN